MFDVITGLFAVCFFVGIIFTLFSVLGGLGHVVGHGGADTGHMAHGYGPADQGDGVSILNLSSLTVFLTWFGAAGFSLRFYGKLGLGPVLLISGILGMFGAYIVYLFLVKLLIRGQSKPLSSSDTYMPGTVAKVTSPISKGGTGEIVYVHLGTRRSCGARSIGDAFITKGSQVVIVQYEKGIAYVKPYSDLLNTNNY